MHVDFVITELNIGGAERCLTELACGLHESAHHVRVFMCGPVPVDEQRVLYDRLVKQGISVTSGQGATPRAVIPCYQRLRAWMVEGRADVCQTFLYHANILGTLAAKSASTAIRIGGIRVTEPSWFRCTTERFAMRHMDHVICVSDAVAEFAQTRLQVPAERCSVIENGVNVTRFATAKQLDWQEFGWPSDSVVAVFIGRLHPQKGIELLQQQVDAIAPASTNRRLLLVGHGPLRESLDRWAKQIGPDRVQLIGFQKDIAPILKASRVLVLPSHFEGMPNVVLEAFASSLPVVCSRVEGSIELLSHAREDQSFDSGDARTMTERLVRFMNDRDFSRQVGEGNLARVKRDFSIPAMVEAYAALYRGLCSRRFDVR